MKHLDTPLYWRLLIWFCLANLLVLLLGGLLARRYFAYASGVETNWTNVASNANKAYETGGIAALTQWSELERQRGIEATLLENGHPLSRINLPPRLRARLPEWIAAGNNVVKEPWPGLYVVMQRVSGSRGQSRQLLALTHSHLHRRTRERIFLGIQLALSLLFIGIVGWWVARSVARPVEALRRATQRMAGGELSVRVGTQGRMTHDELSRLACDFDSMAERIEALVAHDRSVLQDLSHELRSPLARLHLLIDLARHGTSTEAPAYFDQAEQEIVRLDGMLGELLALSRMEGGLPGMECEPVDLADVARTCLERARLAADARHIQMRLVCSDTAVVSGSGLLLERALDNLLANAIKFSADENLVEVVVSTTHKMAKLTVRDHGLGVPPEELPQLFRPFFRGSNARLAEGHGLGLAIVQRVVRAHGGSATMRNSDGGGLEILLSVPLAEAPL